MKKVALFFLALVLLVGYAVNDSVAGLLLCWKIEEQVDADGADKYIEVRVTKTDSARHLLNGIFYNTDGDIAPVVGTMEKSPDGTRRVSLHGTYVDGGKNVHKNGGKNVHKNVRTWILDATVDSKTKNGTIYVRSDGVGTKSFDLTSIPCETAPNPYDLQE